MICDNNVEKRNLHVIFHIFNSILYETITPSISKSIICIFAYDIDYIHNHNHFVIVIHLIFSN